MTPLDDYDRAILRILQKDNRMPQQRIGDAVNLSAPSVQRRIRRMEKEGVIAANVAVISPQAVDLQLTIFVEIELVSEQPHEIDAVKRMMVNAPEVQQCFYVTGEVDFVLVVVVENMAAYENFTRCIFFENNNIRKFRTLVSMDAIKTGSAINI